MAKSKVINTVLNLRDNMSGGLLKAARNAKKAGADIDDSMISATRQVVAFKNKSVKAMQDFAKKSAVAASAAVTGLATAFIALDGATEEYRVAQGKLNTAFDAADLSATAARKSYRNFYAILGDTDTATEASQLLAQLAENEQDVSTWARIAAGAHGTFGDSLPIEGLIEASNETAKVGEVTGVLADALNWVGIMEDDFNDKLSACGTEAKRNKLIMDTLSGAYEDAATAFYENNKQVINARRNQATLSEVTAKLGEASQTAKNGVMQLLGAQEDGSYRAGSALEWLNNKATAFSNWVAGVDVSTLTARFDQGFATMRDKAGQAFDWMKTNVVPVASAFKDAATEAFSWAQENVLPKAEALLGKLAGAFEWVAQNMDKVGPVLEGLIKLWAASKIVKFGTDVVDTGNTLWQFGKTVTKVGGTNLTKMLGGIKGGAGKVFDGLVVGADKLGTGIVKLGGFFGQVIGKVVGVGKGLLGLAAAHPIITGLVIAAGLIIANWDKIKPVLVNLWNTAKEVFGAVRDWAVEKFNAIKDTAIGLLTSVKETFLGIKDAIVGAFTSAKETVAGFFSWLDDKIESIPLLGSLYSGGKSALSWIGGKLTGNALGTSYWRGGLTRVNERGGEIMNLPNGTQIIPHDISARMAGGPRVTVNVTVAGNVIGNEQYADEMGERIVDKLLRAIDNM